MPHQNTPLPGPVLFLAPAAGGAPVDAVPHHPRPEPAGHLCTCGKIREACVHDEVRALWQAVSAP